MARVNILFRIYPAFKGWFITWHDPSTYGRKVRLKVKFITSSVDIRVFICSKNLFSYQDLIIRYWRTLRRPQLRGKELKETRIPRGFLIKVYIFKRFFFVNFENIWLSAEFLALRIFQLIESQFDFWWENNLNFKMIFNFNQTVKTYFRNVPKYILILAKVWWLFPFSLIPLFLLVTPGFSLKWTLLGQSGRSLGMKVDAGHLKSIRIIWIGRSWLKF